MNVNPVENNMKVDNPVYTGKSFSEALILASTNPQYDNRLFMVICHIVG